MKRTIGILLLIVFLITTGILIYLSKTKEAVVQDAPHSKVTYIVYDTTLTSENNPHIIDCTWHISKGVTLTIEKGCDIQLGKLGYINNHGAIIAKGALNDSVFFRPKDEYWGAIFTQGENARLDFRYCHVSDGFFRSRRADVRLSNTKYIIDKKSLIENGKRVSVFWVWKGSFRVDSCYFENNHISEGEGMNINFADAFVRNSVFVRMADAIEYLNVSKGEISGNLVVASPDDAVDVNGCSNVLISQNTFMGNQDKAISVGTEEYGPSHHITIKNNAIIENQFGVSVKDSSFCQVLNNHFVRNDVAIDAHLKNNHTHYQTGGNVYLSGNFFIQNNIDFQRDSSSVIEVKNRDIIPLIKPNTPNN